MIGKPALVRYLKGVSWVAAAGWLCGAGSFGLLLHDRGRVAYCLISLASLLLPSVVGDVRTLQAWLTELGRVDPMKPPAPAGTQCAGTPSAPVRPTPRPSAVGPQLPPTDHHVISIG